jgi:hypothetical protein
MISLTLKGSYASGKDLPTQKINRGRFENKKGIVKISNVKNIFKSLNENYKNMNK